MPSSQHLSITSFDLHLHVVHFEASAPASQHRVVPVVNSRRRRRVGRCSRQHSASRVPQRWSETSDLFHHQDTYVEVVIHREGHRTESQFCAQAGASQQQTLEEDQRQSGDRPADRHYPMAEATVLLLLFPSDTRNQKVPAADGPFLGSGDAW